MNDNAIQIKNLSKNYNNILAVKNMNFKIVYETLVSKI